MKWKDRTFNTSSFCYTNISIGSWYTHLSLSYSRVKVTFIRVWCVFTHTSRRTSWESLRFIKSVAGKTESCAYNETLQTNTDETLLTWWRVTERYDLSSFTLNTLIWFTVSATCASVGLVEMLSDALKHRIIRLPLVTMIEKSGHSFSSPDHPKLTEEYCALYLISLYPSVFLHPSFCRMTISFLNMAHGLLKWQKQQFNKRHPTQHNISIWNKLIFCLVILFIKCVHVFIQSEFRDVIICNGVRLIDYITLVSDYKPHQSRHCEEET